MKISGHACSLIGSRDKQQDAYLVDNDAHLYAVADGVGGGLRGEVASRMATEGFKASAPKKGSLRQCIDKLQADILAEALQSIGEAVMGTTFTGVRIDNGVVTLAHVGDSHCYLIDAGVLKLMNQDHEAYDEAAGGTVLMSYLGIPSDVAPLTVEEEVFSVSPGQSLLLCSDGLYRQLDETRIGILVRENFHQPEELVQKLCQEASISEHSDNITVVFISIR